MAQDNLVSMTRSLVAHGVAGTMELADEVVRIPASTYTDPDPQAHIARIFALGEAFGGWIEGLMPGFAYAGPVLVRQILDGLAALLARDGFTSVADAVGKDV